MIISDSESIKIPQKCHIVQDSGLTLEMSNTDYK